MLEDDWRVRELSDSAEILAILSRDPVYAFYAIGDLDPALADKSRWVTALDGGEPVALALHFSGLEPPALFLFGEGQGIALILGAVLRPAGAFATFLPGHRSGLAAYYQVGPEESMIRMVYQARAQTPSPGREVVRLGMANLGELQRLYRLQPESVFVPDQLLNGVYYGARHEGRLVSAAGTHLLSEAYGRAAVGNVFTHPDYRQRGYAAACTAAVLDELSPRFAVIALNVGADNAGAIRIYERLGFVEGCRFLEAPVIRRGVRGAPRRQQDGLLTT